MVLKQLLFFNLGFLSLGRAEYVMSGKQRHQHKVGQWQQQVAGQCENIETLFYPQSKNPQSNPQSNKTL